MKIRLKNPIKECVSIQGRRYTISWMLTSLAILVLTFAASWADMPICAAISGIAAILSVSIFMLAFGIETLPPSKEEEE